MCPISISRVPRRSKNGERKQDSVNVHVHTIMLGDAQQRRIDEQDRILQQYEDKLKQYEDKIQDYCSKMEHLEDQIRYVKDDIRVLYDGNTTRHGENSRKTHEGDMVPHSVQTSVRGAKKRGEYKNQCIFVQAYHPM